MADEIDVANERAELYRQAAVRAAARPIPQGQPGECYDCGEYHVRLVGGVCPLCRDGR